MKTKDIKEIDVYDTKYLIINECSIQTFDKLNKSINKIILN
jgi:hypothetical protein